MDGATGVRALIGRSREQALLDELLDAARAGRSGGLVVRGEPGVGKTSLLDYAVSRAGGFRVLRMLGAESESDLAFSGLLELLRPVMSRVRELPDVQARALETAMGGSGQVDRFAVYAATLGVVALVAEDGPVLCVVDDAQWVDPASSDALLFTARRLADDGVVILFGAREGEATYFEARGIPDLRLVGLGAEDGGRLVRESSESPLASGVVAQLVAATGGNPLALVEIPGGLRERQRLGTEPLDDPLRAGAAVERAFGARVGHLSASARRALLVAAVSDTDDLAAILLAALEDADALDEAEAAGLIVVEGDRLRFRHPLVRSAMYSGASDGERRRAHAALADALAAVDADRSAWHRALSTVGHDEQVASRLAQVAEAAGRRGGVAAQARLLERSARLTPDPERRADRLHDAGRAAHHAGRMDYAAALLDEALTLATDPRLRADLVESRTDVARGSGGVAQWLDVCRAEADGIAAQDPQRALRLLWQVLWHVIDDDEVESARALLDRMTALSPEPDDDLYVLRARAWVSEHENDIAAVRVATRRSLELGAGHIPEHAIDVAYTVSFIGECDEARAVLEPLIERCRREGSLFDLAQALCALAGVEGISTRVASAEAAASEAVALAIEAGLPYVECLSLAHLAVAEARLGKHVECREHAQRALELSPQVMHGAAPSIAWFAIGISALTDGRIHQAIEALECSRDASGTASWQPELIEAYLRSGRVDDARQLFGVAERDARTIHALRRVARSRATLADEADTETAFDEALRLCDAEKWPLDRARCQLAYGEQLRRSGQRVAARVQLRSALEGFERIGAASHAERARQELRASGEKVRARAADEPEQLTAQELQIALLVAHGATNREAAASVFLSPKTVEKHLSSAYRKLGVRSRTELARRLADQ
jgi:DNA-binding CsgD family transcriptional regulator